MNKKNNQIARLILCLALSISMLFSVEIAAFAADNPDGTTSDGAVVTEETVGAESSEEGASDSATSETSTIDSTVNAGSTGNSPSANSSDSSATNGENVSGSVTNESTSTESDTTTTETTTAEEKTEEEQVELKTAKRFKLNGRDVTFKNAVVTNVLLESDKYTSTLKAKANRNSIKITWGAVKNKSGISGYYILRKDKSGSRWRQIAAVGKNTTSYTDKTAKVKNRAYYYTVVPYSKDSSGYIKVANSAPQVWAVTTRSKKKNVYSVSLTRVAYASCIYKGGTVKVNLTFPKKAYSKNIRWSSSNKKVATVDSSGNVKGISAGTATIYARTHTGYVLSTKISVVNPGTADGMLTAMKSWMGYSYQNGKHKGIIDIYNSVKPLPVGYKMTYYDAWCATAITAAAIRSGNVSNIGRECSVDRFITIFKKMGIWEEDGTITPKKGDLIIYNWRKSSQPNDTNASHIGIVEQVNGTTITVIEGNKGAGEVARRKVEVGWGYIRGYARPNYKE